MTLKDVEWAVPSANDVRVCLSTKGVSQLLIFDKLGTVLADTTMGIPAVDMGNLSGHNIFKINCFAAASYDMKRLFLSTDTGLVQQLT